MSDHTSIDCSVAEIKSTAKNERCLKHSHILLLGLATLIVSVVCVGAAIAHTPASVSTSASATLVDNSSSMVNTSIPSDWKDKIVVFLDIDGVMAPYGLDPLDSPADHLEDYQADDPYYELLWNNCWRNFTDDTLERLSTILDAIPEHQRRLVFTSSWRKAHPCRRNALSKFLEYGARNGGSLAKLTHFDGLSPNMKCHHCRQKEIGTWVLKHTSANSSLAAWIVLDDLDVLRGEYNELFQTIFQGHAIHVNGALGLTDLDVTKANYLVTHQLAGRS